MPDATELTELIADVREQVLYLQELGVGTFDVKLSEVDAGNLRNKGELRTVSSESRAVSGLERISDLKFEISNLKTEVLKPAESRAAGSRLSSLPSLSQRPAGAVGKSRDNTVQDLPESGETLPISSVPDSPVIPEKVKQETALFDVAPTLGDTTDTIESIRAEIGPDCTRCKLSTLGRSKVVNSTGNFNADLMFVGEAPGADEDAQGFPFVGRAGKLLTDIMMAIGFNREDVFIGNINRCRPPGNRAPEPDETIACKPFLKREIAVVRPKVIVVLGATAAQNLLETKAPIGKLRGNFHDYLGTKVMPTFHPAYLLRDPHKKREGWEEMKVGRDFLKGEG